MNTLAQIIQSLSEEEISQAFDEIMEYNKCGCLGMDTLVRKIRDDYAKEMGSPSLDMNCMFVCNEVTFEIAKRHYGIV